MAICSVRRSAAAVFAAAGLTIPCAADDLANWNVSAYVPANTGAGVTPLPPQNVAPHVTATPITAGPGLHSLDPCGGPLALTACAGTADMWAQYYSVPFDPADYFEFALTAESGYSINYQAFQIPMGVLYIVDNANPANGRSTGPKTWELRYSTDGFATPGTTLWTGDPFPFSIPGLPGLSVGASEEVHLQFNIAAVGAHGGTVTFRFYGYNPETHHPTAPLGYGAGPTNRTYFGLARFDGLVSGTVNAGICYANCDNSSTPPILNVNDFVCFLGRYAAGDSYANCDSSTITPVLNVNDFVCFLGRYAQGCP